MEGVASQLLDVKAQQQAIAFLAQARDFYEAAGSARTDAAKPLLLYYSFLNLAKALIVQRANKPIKRIYHGVAESWTGPSVLDGEVTIPGRTKAKESAFLRFAAALGASAPVGPFLPSNFLSQVLIGHRVFSGAALKTEKFVSIDRINYLQDSAKKEVWSVAKVYLDDLTRLGYSQKHITRSDAVTGKWTNVASAEKDLTGRRLILLEQSKKTPYGQRPSQVLSASSADIKDSLFRSISAVPPYRKYYFYVSEVGESVLPQMISLYLATFYLGSLTRYNPVAFQGFLRGRYGPFIREFFANQPQQFLYAIASEFNEQEVARAAIIAA